MSVSGYYLPWLLLIVISLWISLAAFFWALKAGQFSDQQRARYLPLRGEAGPAPLANPSRVTREVYALAGVLCMGALGLLATLLAVFFRSGGG
jgi:cbb3-type cytochrome oxidase maturation protein